jgi:3D (Asp-Asp-Asp) domain-containing protein
MRRIALFLIYFVFLSLYPVSFSDKSKDIVWNDKDLAYVIEKVRRENLKKEEVLRIKEYVIITAYTPSVWETDSTPFITASGKRISESYVAVSRDLLPKFPFGTKVKIFIPDKNLPGCGKEVIGKSWIVRYVEDTMNRRHSKKIDLVFFSREKAINFGKCRGVIVAEHL